MGHEDVTAPTSPTPVWLPQDPPTPPATSDPFAGDPFPDPYSPAAAYGPPGAPPRPPAAPPYRGPYGAPMRPHYASAAPQGVPAIAVIGLVLAVLVPLAGLIVSIVALVRIRRTGAPGRGLAITGIVIPCIGLLASIAIPIYMSQRHKAEAAPRGAFENMQAAFVEGDCYAYLASTTPNMQFELGMTDCTEFDAYVAEVNAMGGFGTPPIVDVSRDGDVATVTTLERLDWGVENVEYTVVRTDGGWRVDGLAFVD